MEVSLADQEKPSEEGALAGFVQVVSPLLPFLATRASDFVVFEYIPLATAATAVTVLLPDWSSVREVLELGSEIQLHIDVVSSDFVGSGGRVQRLWQDADRGGQVCLLEIWPGVRSHDRVALNVLTGTILPANNYSCNQDMEVVRLLKQAIIAKRGLAVYLKHLIPLFSRIGGADSQNHSLLKVYLWSEISARVNDHLEALTGLMEIAKRCMVSETRFADFVDPVELRSLLTLEFPHDLLQMTFPALAVRPYLDAINALETNLLAIHNSFVARLFS